MVKNAITRTRSAIRYVRSSPYKAKVFVRSSMLVKVYCKVPSSSKNSTYGFKLHRMDVDGGENAVPSQHENLNNFYNEFDDENAKGVVNKCELDTYLEEVREKRDVDGF
ncbi:hypothetical protein V6N13_111071 [Hibiscus sabdariffa]